MQKYILLYTLIGWLMVGINPVLAKSNFIHDSLQILRFEVNGIPFSMQRVEGGVFVMGGTREQHREAISTDLPAHTVALNAYYIGHTEVTQALWQTVMQEEPITHEGYNPNLPVTNISWYDCQRFIHRLDSITNMPFRLPTEAEWEFAARGGNNSQEYRFAGSFTADSVAWILSNAGFRKHTVGEKIPNELGLYDMTGNVSEWCEDWYAPYQLGTDPNPRGPINGTDKIIRGSSFDNCEANCHISHRYLQSPIQATNYCGLRLALTLPNEPTLQLIEEPTIVKKVKIKNIKIKLQYVATDTPYYISEEPITKRLWNKVMNTNETEADIIVDKTNNEWYKFLERCRKISHEPLSFASELEIEQAVETEIILLPKTKKAKQRHWEKDIHSIQKHRKNAKKAQKWADLIGVQIKTTDDPTLLLYTTPEKNNQPRWLVIRK